MGNGIVPKRLIGVFLISKSLYPRQLIVPNGYGPGFAKFLTGASRFHPNHPSGLSLRVHFRFPRHPCQENLLKGEPPAISLFVAISSHTRGTRRIPRAARNAWNKNQVCLTAWVFFLDPQFTFSIY
jgi:hypothetical protein